MNDFFKSVGFRVIFSQIALLIFLLVSIAIIGRYFLIQIIERHFLLHESEYIQSFYIDEIDLKLSKSINAVLEFVNRVSVKEFLKNESNSSKKMSHELKEDFANLKRYYGFNTIYGVNIDTKNYYSEDGFVKTLDLEDKENAWFLNTIKSNKNFTINLDSAVTGRLNFWIDAKVFDDSKNVVGLAGGAVDVSCIIEHLIELENGYPALITIIDNKGEFKGFGRDRDNNGLFVEDIIVSNEFEKAIVPLLNKERHYVKMVENGEEMLLFMAHIKELDFKLIISIKQSVLLGRYNILFQALQITSLIFVVIFGLISFLIIMKLFIKPLKDVAYSIETFSPDTQIGKFLFENQGLEFELIGQRLNKSAELLSRQHRELEHVNSNLNELINIQTMELKNLNTSLKNKIYEIRVKNQQLLEANKKALELAQAKSNFISSVSHELRTPLNSIINFTDQILEDFDEIIEDKELQDEAKDFLRRVLRNSNHLLQLINDILEFTKIEAGKIEYEFKDTQLDEILENSYFNTKSLTLNTDIDYRLNMLDKNLVAVVDRRRFMQIMLNLVSNAIKFTKE